MLHFCHQIRYAPRSPPLQRVPLRQGHDVHRDMGKLSTSGKYRFQCFEALKWQPFSPDCTADDGSVRLQENTCCVHVLSARSHRVPDQQTSSAMEICHYHSPRTSPHATVLVETFQTAKRQSEALHRAPNPSEVHWIRSSGDDGASSNTQNAHYSGCKVIPNPIRLCTSDHHSPSVSTSAYPQAKVT